MPRWRRMLTQNSSYTAYTAGVMIAYQASQRALNNEPYTDDVKLLEKCISVLEYCAIKDTLAGRFRNILAAHMGKLQDYRSQTRDGEEFATPPTSLASDSLFFFDRGSSELHTAVFDLLRLIHRPFSGLKDVATKSTLSNRAETTMGTHLEWEYELKNRDDPEVPPNVDEGACVTDVRCEPTQSQCSPFDPICASQELSAPPSEEAWTKWTPATWQSSFHTSPK